MLLSHFFVSRSAGWGITDLRIQGGNPTIPFKRISTCEEFENCSPLTSLSCFTVIVSPSFEFVSCPDTWSGLVRLIHWHHVDVWGERQLWWWWSLLASPALALSLTLVDTLAPPGCKLCGAGSHCGRQLYV